MEKAFRTMKNRSVIVILLFLLVSCNTYNEVITDWYYLDEEQKGWLVDSTNLSFVMCDQNGISRAFVQNEKDHYFLEGSSFFAGIKHGMSQREYYYQNFQSNYQDRLNISMHADIESDISGGDLWISLNDLTFSYDYFHEEITKIELRDTMVWLSVTSDGIEDSMFNSTLMFLDEYTQDDITYEDVFYFNLNDFHAIWNDNTITELYFSKGIGLLRYNLNNGLVFKRK